MRPHAVTRLHALPLGEIDCVHEVFAPGVDDGARHRIPVLSFLVEHEDGPVLVDTGMHRVHVDDPDATFRGTPTADELTAVMGPDDMLENRLRERGFAPGDVRHVVNTHLHFDHAGNNDLVDAATFHVQREHLRFAAGSPSCPDRYWNVPGLRYEPVDGDAEILPGIAVTPTPGHLPGHQSVVLDLPRTGRVVLTGDAVHCALNFAADDWSHHDDPAGARRSALRLRAMDATLVFGHDRDQLTDLFDGGARALD